MHHLGASRTLHWLPAGIKRTESFALVLFSFPRSMLDFGHNSAFQISLYTRCNPRKVAASSVDFYTLTVSS